MKKIFILLTLIIGLGLGSGLVSAAVTVYDFSNQTQGINAIRCASADAFNPSNPPNQLHPTCAVGELNITNNTALNLSDNVDVGVTADSGAEAYFFYEFQINGAVNNILYEIEFETGPGSADAEFYVFNHSANDWLSLATDPGDSGSIDDIMNSSRSGNNADLISSARRVHLLLVEKGSNAASFTTDYLRLEVSFNSAPTVTNILQNHSNFSSTAVTNFTYNVTDSDSSTLTNATLFVNGSVFTFVNSPSVNTTLNFTTDNIPQGNSTWFITAFDEQNASSNSETYFIHINTPPKIASVNINDSSPIDTVDLNCTIGAVTDFDGETVVLSYDWLNKTGGDFLPLGFNTSVLTAANTTANDEWQCRVTPTDSFENGTVQTSGTVSINTGLATPSVNTTNATTNATSVISSAANPTANNSYVNLSTLIIDDNPNDKWTVYFCDTSTPSVNGCQTTTYCSTTLNSTDNPASCLYNVSPITATSITVYTFVVDNSSLVSTASSTTVHVNHPVTVPTILSPTSNITQNSIEVNFTATDSDSDVINFTFYNSSDSLGFSELKPNNSSGFFNWTSLSDGTYFLKAFATDAHNYNLDANSSISNFTVDTTNPSIIQNVSIPPSVERDQTVQLYANLTDVTSSIKSVTVQITNPNSVITNHTMSLFSGTNQPNSETRWNFNFTTSVVGTHTTIFHISDAANNAIAQAGSSFSATTPPGEIVTVGGGGGGGSETVLTQCTTTQDCRDSFGINYFCRENFCLLNTTFIAAAVSCNYNSVCESGIGESWFNCRCDQAVGCGIQEEESGDCTFGLGNLVGQDPTRPQPTMFLLVLGGISLLILIVLFSPNIFKRSQINKQLKMLKVKLK